MIICKGNGFTESAYLNSAGSHSNGVVVATEFVVGAKGDDINKKYNEKYGEDFNGHSAEAYTTTWVVIDAMKQIADAGNEVGRLPYSTIAFEEDEFNGTPYLNQNLNATLTVTQISNGKYVPIWPYDIAQADVIYPATYE